MTSWELFIFLLWYGFAGFMVLCLIVYVSILVINNRTPTPHPPQTPPIAGASADDGEPAAQAEA